MELENRMRVLLLRLELVSNGAVQSWNSSGSGGGEPDDRVVLQVSCPVCSRNHPTQDCLEHDPPHLVFRHRWEGAVSERARSAVVEAAEEELRSLTVRSAPLVECVSLDQMIVEDAEGLEALLVAARFNVTPGLVRKVRVKAGRDPESGLRPGDVAVGERPARALALLRGGASTRSVATVLGVSQRSVVRWTRDAA